MVNLAISSKCLLLASVTFRSTEGMSRRSLAFSILFSLTLCINGVSPSLFLTFQSTLSSSLRTSSKCSVQPCQGVEGYSYLEAAGGLILHRPVGGSPAEVLLVVQLDMRLMAQSPEQVFSKLISTLSSSPYLTTSSWSAKQAIMRGVWPRLLVMLTLTSFWERRKSRRSV